MKHKKMTFSVKWSVAAILMIMASVVLGGQANAQTINEAPSTVNATYVPMSATKKLNPGEKVANIFTLNSTREYLLQRITDRTYWYQRQFYGTLFYVGDTGVLLIDPLGYQGPFIQKAISSVTSLPVTAILYSHNHADHIGDATYFVDQAAKAGKKLRIIASKATADKQEFLASKLPKATEIVSWPKGSFNFEGLKVQFSGFERAAHTDDHGVWLLTNEKVAHLPDLVNPDQPPFWNFAGSENFTYYESNVKQLGELKWDYLHGGHGNIGSSADIEFYQEFLGDFKAAIGKALGEIAFGSGVDAKTINAHTVYLPTWLDLIAKNVTDALRPKYGKYYGFEHATPSNARMAAMSMFSYQ
jgi:glyoxylase-like metal-dependent hydrolase (beta-lactamase superfamily II)